jgi:hypothetical protein
MVGGASLSGDVSWMTQQEFISALVGPSADEHELVFRQVRERLRRLTDEQQFRILFSIAVKSQLTGNFPVCDAAIILRELSPDCPLSCEDAVRGLLPDWDISIEEVPFYLAARFGSHRVRQAVQLVGQDATSSSDKQMLSTVLYWLGRYDDTYPQTNS